MNLAFFVAEFPVLSETFVLRQVAAMVAAGHRVTVIAGQWGERELEHALYREHALARVVCPVRPDEAGWLTRLGLISGLFAAALADSRIRRVALLGLRAALKGSPASLLDIASRYRRGTLGRFDAIVAHFGPAGVRAMHLQQAGLLEGPLTTVFHGFDVSDRATLRKQRINYRELFAHCARLLPISQLWRSRLIEWGADPARVEVLRMGVDLGSLTMLDPARPLGRPLRVLSVARFTEKKGLCYAIEGVIAATGAIHFQIVGSGPEEARLRSLAGSPPAGKTVEFLGRRSQQEVFAALERADVFLLPSVTAAGGDMEGIPVALMEAMAKGVLVIATRHSGIPELVEDGCSGVLVAERSSAGIAAALDRIGTGAVDVESMRRHARERIETEYSNAVLDAQLTRTVASLGAASGREVRTVAGSSIECAETP